MPLPAAAGGATVRLPMAPSKDLRISSSIRNKTRILQESMLIIIKLAKGNNQNKLQKGLHNHSMIYETLRLGPSTPNPEP